MIYYTNIGTIAPDNNYLVFSSDGTMVGQLSSSFVSSLRRGTCSFSEAQRTGSRASSVQG